VGMSRRPGFATIVISILLGFHSLALEHWSSIRLFYSTKATKVTKATKMLLI
jgi:hypothetical protein